MQQGKLSGVVNFITQQGNSRPPTLTAVQVKSKGNVLHEIVLDGGGIGQMVGVPNVYDGFEIPGITEIDTPSMRGVKLRTITKIPDGFRCDFNPQSGVWTASFGLKPPAVLEAREDAVMGYWCADGFVLAAYGNAGMSLAQLSNAVHRRDVAICLGSDDGEIGCDTLRIIIVSMLSDQQRDEFLAFDNGLVEKRDALGEDMRHFNGAGSIKAHQAKHEPAELPANDRQSA